MSLNKCIVLAAAAAVLLAGCSGKGSPAPEGGGAESAAASATAAAGTKAPDASAQAATDTAGGTAEAEGTTPSASASPQEAAGSPAATALPEPTGTPKGIETDGWVTGIPGNVPQFRYGTLDGDASKIVEGSVSSAFTLCFRGVGKADIDEYAETLKSQGYNVAVAEIGDTYTLTASQGGTVLVITLSEQDSTATFALGAPV